MKKRILATLLFGIVILTMIGFYFKAKANTNINDIEGNGNLIITSNLMNALSDLGESHEFIPLEYKDGVASGIISSTKIDNYMLESNKSTDLNLLRDREYTINAIEQNSFLQETGNILDLNVEQNSLLHETWNVMVLNELSQYVLDAKDPKNIILKDNKNKTEKNYTSKVLGDFIVIDPVAYSGDASQINVNDFQNNNGKIIFYQYSNSEIVGKDNRYIYAILSYREDYHKDDNKNVIVIYDLQTESFYESEIMEPQKYEYYKRSIFEVNNNLYHFKSDGKIRKIVLSDGEILFEEYYDLGLSEEELLMTSYAYADNNIEGDNIFVKTGKISSDGVITNMTESILNMRDKTVEDLPVGEDYINIHKIFSNSDNLAMVSTSNNTSNKIWIAKYEDGEFKNLVPIDKIHPRSPFLYTPTIEDILYDRKTNSFFIKRKIGKDKKTGYQYEVLKLE